MEIILSALDEREGSIEEAMNAAKKARNEVQNLKSENENILKEAKEERAKIINEANTIKDRIIAGAKDVAKVEAKKLVADAKESIENQRMAAIVEVKNHVCSAFFRNS